ncbi:uncharacterized protein NECHADRAFT_99310 [Fusarium vanettenii 77-13-4]|uniref:Expressed protein n=1 Tax=Fusarium vanettenii (strain ATCC MYA-4622 / CBS 123669 / FGSC 9596 / NRRL 45880 / 77-13-4) TaxID=660122 RepID=C7Z4V8_FUSV7|nr:uncharacterized protein NECHADRAFT_99310 [Fusarium vanettenii 77-13-4]EEU40990.1 expressed protein [Fusarium vanettenii 77-13-4]
MSHRSDTHREASRRERSSRGREQAPQHQGHRQPSVSQVLHQQMQQQQQQQYTPSYASSSGYAATGAYASYDTSQGQSGTPDYVTQGYPQAPSTPRAHQGSVPDSQYSPGRADTRVRIGGYQDDPEDSARRTESFVRDGDENRVAASRSSQSRRAHKKKRKDKARSAIDEFDAAYPNAAYDAANPHTNQYTNASGQYNEDPDLDCGNGPNQGGSSYEGY